MAKFSNGRFAIEKINQGKNTYKTLCIICQRTSGSRKNKDQGIQEDATYPLLDSNNTVLPESLSIAKLCGFTEKEIVTKITAFLQAVKTQKPKTSAKNNLVEQINACQTIEDVCAIWQKIDHQHPLNKTIENFIMQKISQLPFKNPYFFVFGNVPQYIEDIEDWVINFFYLTKACLIKYPISPTNQTLSFEATTIKKQDYHQALFKKMLKVMQTYKDYGNPSETMYQFFLDIFFKFEYYNSFTYAKDALYSIFYHICLEYPETIPILKKYNNQVVENASILKDNENSFFDELSLAHETKSILHYTNAYWKIETPTEQEYLFETKKEFEFSPFQENQYLLISRILYNLDPKNEKIQKCILALLTLLDNEEMRKNLEINQYHQEFFSILSTLEIPLEQNQTILNELFLLYNKHTRYYTKETKELFSSLFPSSFKRQK